VDGGADDDTIWGDTGADVLAGNSGNDIVNGGTGNDWITGGDGNDTLNGDAGVDHIDGGAGDDRVNGGTGNDYLRGGAGADTVHGDAGNDQIEGNSGNDALYGDAGDDLVLGNDGNDSLWGGEGSDTLLGGAGADNLYGGKRADVLIGGLGNDNLKGGSDGDDFVFGHSENGATELNFGNDTILDFDVDNQDTIVFNKAFEGDLTAVISGDDVVITAVNDEGAGEGGTVRIAGLVNELEGLREFAGQGGQNSDRLIAFLTDPGEGKGIIEFRNVAVNTVNWTSVLPTIVCEAPDMRSMSPSYELSGKFGDTLINRTADEFVREELTSGGYDNAHVDAWHLLF
jgi:Ca2+-binding RTX toxin-like protein